MPVTSATVGDLIEQIHSARAESDRLFSILKPAAIYERPIAQRHRVIFYVGHLDGFDSIQICREGLGLKSPDAALDDLFQAGIDPDSTHLPTDTAQDWPSVDAVSGYVKRCRGRVDEYINHAPEDTVCMALEHRLMHLETLAYMFHNFDCDLKISPDNGRLGSGEVRTVENIWIEIPAGEVTLGRPDDGSFGWDNEYQETKRRTSSFRIQKYPVTNGAYLRFVEAGAALPNFWTKRGDSIFVRGMFDEFPLPLNWPAYVTQTEAENYAAWAGKSLATEEMFHRAAYGTLHGSERPYPWGNSAPDPKRGNFDFVQWDPEPVNGSSAGDSAFGVSQLVGNGWEWTSTPFAPLPGFRARESYPGYSANFFDGDHFVLKGGSSRTAARLLRRSFRNWFRRDYPYMYAKFRCVEI